MANKRDLLADRAIARRLKRCWTPFFQRFGRLTAGQRDAIPYLLEGRDLLLSSPTASGKTEAACAPLVERYLAPGARALILYVSPTRALVNDLYQRLERPLQECGVSLARRTGDHRTTTTAFPQVLLTTPESMDSLLCRARSRELGHLLAHTVAVVLDEIHLLVGTSRGEQLRWLLHRLRRLRTYARQQGWICTDGLQIAALSATVADEEGVARDYLGRDRKVVTLSGGREIEVIEPGSSQARVEHALVTYLEAREQSEKVLVFCNTRRRVDGLTLHLRERLRSLDYEIRAHHGSLAKPLREQAEADVKSHDRIVLIATSTLEIGIDIGDIDLVALDGPPPDIAALLQRIGRGNRRTRRTRVLPCAQSDADAIVLSAMLESAREGELGPIEWGPNYAVAIQQVASFILQGPNRARPRSSLKGLIAECAPSIAADALIDHMVRNGDLDEDIDGIRLGETWRERTDRGSIHSNIDAPLGTIVVDEVTGETLAVGIDYRGGAGLQVGGRNLEARRWGNNRLEVRQTADKIVTDDSWGYQSRGAMKGVSQPDAVRRYLGLPENEWPILAEGNGVVVFHFGGARRSALLRLLMELFGPGDGVTVNEWFLRLPRNEVCRPSWIDNARLALVEIQLGNHLDTLEHALRRPRANRQLPEEVRLAEVREWLHVESELAKIQQSVWTPVSDKTIHDALGRIYKSLVNR